MQNRQPGHGQRVSDVLGNKDTIPAPGSFPRTVTGRPIAPKVAAVFRTIFAQPAAGTVSATWDQLRDQFGGRFPQIAEVMDGA